MAHTLRAALTATGLKVTVSQSLELMTLVVEDNRNPLPTRAFGRVMEGGVVHAQGLGRETATGADLLVAIFDEKESPAAWLLGEQRITQQDALNFLHYGMVLHSGSAER